MSEGGLNPFIVKDNSKCGTEETAKGTIPLLSQKILNQNVRRLQSSLLFLFPIPENKEKEKYEDIFASDRQCILESDTKGEVHTGNIVGFVGLGRERLIIRSRFAEDDDYFFQYLLERITGLSIMEMKANRGEEEVLQLLPLLFPRFLSMAIKKGPYREYVSRSYNDPHFCGKLDTSRYIKQNIPFTGNISYKRQVFSSSNPVMELVRCTADFIGKSHKHLLSVVKNELDEVERETPDYKFRDMQRIISQNEAHRVKNPLYLEYAKLQRLCLAILRNRKISYGTAMPEQLYGILFDCSYLWEEYIAMVLGDIFDHPRNIFGEKAHHLFFCNVGNHPLNGRIYPDFISRSFPTVIADAKYKPSENIKGDDLRRMALYLWRFDSKSGHFIYPEDSWEKSKRTWEKCQGDRFKGQKEIGDGNVILDTYPIHVPKGSESFKTFANSMKESERDLTKWARQFK